MEPVLLMSLRATGVHLYKAFQKISGGFVEADSTLEKNGK